MSRHLPARPNLEHLKKQAKDLLSELQQQTPDLQLADAQHALARDYFSRSATDCVASSIARSRGSIRAIMQTAADGRTEARAIVPRPVQVFLAFSAAVTILELLTLAEIFRWLAEATVPFTGWAAAMPYMFALAAWPAFLRGRGYAPDVKALRSYLRAQCVTLAIATVLGIVDFFLFSSLQESDNPWLRYSLLRPLWTVVTPTAWCVVLWRARGKISRGA